MSKNFVYTGIGILALIAIVMSYKIYQQQSGYKKSPASTPSYTAKPGTPFSSSKASNNTQTPAPSVQDFSAARRVISAYPGPSASDDQKKEYQKVIDTNAQFSGTLDISSCNTTPLVLKVKNGSDLTLVNNDSAVRSIFFGPGKQYDVAAKNSSTIKVDLNTGVNMYRCNLTDNPIVGVFVVSE